MREALHRGQDGALVFDGWPTGAVYLLDGCVAHAETPPSARRSAVRGDLAGGTRPEDSPGGFGAARHEVAAPTESVLVEAILALLADAAVGDPPARFLPGARPGLATDVRLDEAAVEGVLARGRAQPARPDLGSATVVEPAAPAWRWRVLTAEDWRVLCRVGERARVRDLARTTDLGVGEVVDRVADLVRAGLCVVRPDPPGAGVAAGARTTGAAEGSAPVDRPGRVAVDPAGEDEEVSLPRRTPGESLVPVAAAPEGALAVRPAGLDVPAPDAQTLRRLLGSLQRLDV